MKKKINWTSFIGIFTAVGAGLIAFVSEIDSQRKDKQIADMENRISILENKESE